jgi:hypothetical protein
MFRTQVALILWTGPNGTLSNQLHGLGVVLARTLLRTHLHNPLVLPRRIDHDAAFAHGQRQRLLT